MNLRLSLIATGTAIVLSSASLSAQQMPLHPGDRVRVALGDSASQDLWRVGRVLKATRMGMLVAPNSARADTLPVRLTPPTRLQLARPSHSRLALSTGIGIGVGAGIGLLLPPSTFGRSWGDPGHVGEVIFGALVGGGLGALSGILFAPPDWVDVPLSERGIPIAPLERPVTRHASFSRLERWEVFDPTEADFAAFFEAHTHELDWIEGIWNRGRVGNRDALRVAIVRDRRFEGYDYVAVQLPSRGAWPLGFSPGAILFVLRQSAEPGRYEVRHLDDVEGRVQIAYPDGNDLQMTSSDGAIYQWTRVRRGPQ